MQPDSDGVISDPFYSSDSVSNSSFGDFLNNASDSSRISRSSRSVSSASAKDFPDRTPTDRPPTALPPTRSQPTSVGQPTPPARTDSHPAQTAASASSGSSGPPPPAAARVSACHPASAQSRISSERDRLLETLTIEPPRPPPQDKHDELSSSEQAKEKKQIKKWQKMLGHEPDPKATPEPDAKDGPAMSPFRRFRKEHPRDFEKCVLEGIPDKCRSSVWYEVLDSKPGDAGGKPRPTVAQLCNKTLPAPTDRIAADVEECLESLRNVSESVDKEALVRVLTAYSKADREFGYLRGMAWIAGLLSAYLNEARTFWAFWQITHGNRHELAQLYAPDLARLKELNRIWEIVLENKYSKVAKHLKDVKIHPMLYTPRWFLTGFQIIQFPKQVRLQIFDRQIAFGNRALISFGLTIVGIGKKKLETAAADVCRRLLQNPMQEQVFRNWREVIKKFNANFLKAHEYARVFKVAGIKQFP